MRWDEITDEISERIDFELETIRNMGFPSYFLIVWDFLKAARELDVSVGPGRGSAAGSAVAYCLRITEIDPIKYDLLFERFLNPERVNMPDIDIDLMMMAAAASLTGWSINMAKSGWPISLHLVRWPPNLLSGMWPGCSGCRYPKPIGLPGWFPRNPE